jgi:hypothetical protein
VPSCYININTVVVQKYLRAASAYDTVLHDCTCPVANGGKKNAVEGIKRGSWAVHRGCLPLKSIPTISQRLDDIYTHIAANYKPTTSADPERSESSRQSRFITSARTSSATSTAGQSPRRQHSFSVALRPSLASFLPSLSIHQDHSQ